MALESGAVHVEGKALLVPMEDELTVRAEGATDTEFVLWYYRGMLSTCEWCWCMPGRGRQALWFAASRPIWSWLPCYQ